MAQNSNDTTWLSAREAADLMPVCRTTLCRWRNRGFGPKFFKRGGVIRYRLRDVQDYIDRYLEGGDPPPNARHTSGDDSDGRAA